MEKKKQAVNAIHWLRNTLALDKTIKDSTRSDYVKQIKSFEEFINDTGKSPISFIDINLPLIKDYEQYLFNKKVGKGKTTKTTTVGNKVEKIICILGRAEQQGMIDIHEAKLDKYKKPQSRQGNDNEIYLSEDEIDKIYALQLTGVEEKVRDLFVLQCWIGQRFADTQSINDGIIKDAPNGTGKVIEIVQEKKTHRVSIPLLPVAIEILDKYKTGFPLYSNQTALNYLKKIGEKAGITRLHNVTEDRGGEVTTKQVPAYELIGTHTARRSFVSNMLQRGYDASIIMRITGHNDIESFQKYVKITSDDAANVILKKESGKVLSETKKESTEQKVTAQDVNNFVAIIDTVKQTYNEDIKKQKAEQKMEDASSILISLAEDDIDAHSIAKAIERTGLEVSLSDSATSRNFILRKDTKKKKIKFEEIDESE